MHVFLLMIIPIVYLVTLYLCNKRKIDREQAFCLFWGFVIACIYCLIDFFAIGMNQNWINSLSYVWVHFLVTETLLPVVISIIPLFFAKDTVRNKLHFVFPMIAAFMMIFLPYRIISENTAPDFFRMILYPLLVAVMIFNADTAASLFDDTAEINKALWLRSLLAFFALVSGLLLPSLFQAFYYLEMADAGTYVLAAVFILGSAGFRTVSMLFLPASER